MTKQANFQNQQTQEKRVREVGLTFTDIKLEKENYAEYDCDESQTLSNLGRINIFIGANNSGKSRLMRKLVTDENLQFKTKEINLTNYNARTRDFMISLKQNNLVLGRHFPEFRNVEETTGQIDFLSSNKDHSQMLNFFSIIDSRIKRLGNSIINMIEVFKLKYDGYKEYFMELFNNPASLSFHKYQSIYIPSLRGLRPLQYNYTNKEYSFQKNDVYLARTQNDYKLSNNDNYSIYTGLSFYDDLSNLITNEKREFRLQRNSFEKFLSETFFKGDEVEIIPVKDKDVVYIRIGEIQKPIFELGDGIQSIIALTYPLYFNQGKNIKFFFEEPETHLHPGFQRLFVEILLKPEFSSFQYFFTTHSNHFLDMTLETDLISVYTFESKILNNKNQIFKITNVENSNSNILTLIGAQNSSVFLANCTIWVEGITDRLYLRKYLQLYQEANGINYIENIHFSFVEYAGSNITHWSFLDQDNDGDENIKAYSISNKIMLICDNDGIELDIPKKDKPSKKELRIQKLKKIFRDDGFELLKRREIENFLTSNIIRETVSVLDKKGTSIDFSKINYEKYERTYLGKYLDRNLSGNSKSYADKSGTIKDKVKFARTAISKMNKLSEISPDAKKLVEKIYKFIESSNKLTA